MGGILPSKVQEIPVADTDEAVKAACQHLQLQLRQGRLPEPQELYHIIRTLNNRLKKDRLQYNSPQGAMAINQVLIRLWYAPNFEQLVYNLFLELMRNLELVANKSMLMIRVYEWKYLDELCELVLCLSCSKLYYTLNNIEVLRGNLDEATRKLLEQCNPSSDTESRLDEEARKGIFAEKLDKEESERIYKCMLLVLSEFIKLETATISRSKDTLQVTERFARNCFMLFLRIYFNHNHFEDLRKRAVKVNNEANLENASYFLAKALQQKNASLYNGSVLFLLSLVCDNKTNRHITSLPSHLFPQLPTLTTTNLYDFLLNIVLLALVCQKKEQGRLERKINGDRFYSYRLALMLLGHGLATLNQVSVFYLEIISRHTKPTMMERIYITDLAKEAVKVRPSEALGKYASMDSIDYQVAFSNRTITIRPSELRQYLSNIHELLCDEVDMHFQQYVRASVLQQQEQLRDDDKLMWDMAITRRKEHIRMTSGNF